MAGPSCYGALRMTERVEGSCHCGTVRLNVPWLGRWDSVRRCDCSFCRRRFVAVASVPVGDLQVHDPDGALTLYQFGTRTAEHYFCSRCGIYTHHRRRSNPSEFGVNIACFPGTDVRLNLDVPVDDGIAHPNDR